MKHFLYIPALYQLKDAASIKQRIPKGCNIIIKNSDTRYLTEISSTIHKCNKEHGIQISGIIVSAPVVVNKYVSRLYGSQVVDKSEATIDMYQGAMFEHPTVTADGKTKYTIPVVVVPSPESLRYSASNRFLWDRYLSKLWDTSWFEQPKLDWFLSTEENAIQLYKNFTSTDCILMSVDIETKQHQLPPEIGNSKTVSGIKTEGMWYLGYERSKKGEKTKRLVHQMPIITCIGYTGIFKTTEGKLFSKTVVIPMDSMQNIALMRKYNSLPCPKVLQNGRYDSIYLLRYNAPLYNYVFDTYMLMHSYYCELRRSLAHISAFFIRNHMYWKDESGGNLYEYNAKDCHATAWACLQMLTEMPEWAHENYLGTFKQLFPCITCSIEGFREDPVESDKLWAKYKKQMAEDQGWWNTVITEDFNVGSHIQVKKLFNTLLGTNVSKCDKPTLNGIIHKHPLWRLMVDKLIDTRESKKADSTYMDITLFAGRILYDIDPSATDTGRYASKASSFWCGVNIQNQPEYVKSKYLADIGYDLNAIDNAQSESRTTAYTSLDEALIDAVENSKDFHVRNASRFFGISEEQLFEYKESNPTLYKKIRNKIGKKLNHGANYNMEEYMLIVQMTPLEVIAAKHTLGLPGRWTLFQVASYLLQCFDDTYPLIRSKDPGGYHHRIIEEVKATQMLVTPDGWTRFTFHNDPENINRHLNALVAHIPQSWSVRIINRAFYDSFKRYQIVENVMRMKAQIHDELMFQTKPEHTKYVVSGVSKLMARPNKYTDKEGEEQFMVIPNDPIVGAERWSQLEH